MADEDIDRWDPSSDMRRVAAVEPRLEPTVRFYDWELRGRGWQVWPYTVNLEPTFVPFKPRAARLRPVDNAHKPHRVAEFFRNLLGLRRQDVLDVPREETEPEPAPFVSTDSLIELQVALPQDADIRPSAIQAMLATTVGMSSPFGFELVGTSERIAVQYVTRAGDAPDFQRQLQIRFPEAVVSESGVRLREIWDASESERFTVDFGLREEFVRPLKTFRRFDPDPLGSVLASMSELECGDCVVFQVVATPARSNWIPQIQEAVGRSESEAFFEDAPEMVRLTKEKLESSLFAAVVRVGARASTRARLRDIAKAVLSSFGTFAKPLSNGLIPLANDEYFDGEHEQDLLDRTSHRSGMLLNADELSGLAHPPSRTVVLDRLVRHVTRTKSAPTEEQRTGSVTLGANEHRGKSRTVVVTQETRLRHFHLIGASGTGKSTLLLDLILQDIRSGVGVAVLDPHGDLIDEVAGNIPDSRVSDVVLIDPSDVEHPVGLNILSADSELEKTLLSSDLVGLFRRFTSSWGDQMTTVLSNAVLAILESPNGGTLADLRRFLIEPDFRDSFLQTVGDAQIVYFWQREFPLLKGHPQGPILTRLDTFLRSKTLRAMVNQTGPGVRFGTVMDQGGILLARLSHGAIGEENASILGTLVVAKLQQFAMSRQALPGNQRRPFFLYIDEFHHFLTPSLASMLSGARKYGLGLILAHQDLGQLFNVDRQVADSLLANAGTRVCFRVGDDDAKRLQKGFKSFDATDLMSLGRGEAICRIDQASADFNLRTRVPSLNDPATAALRRDMVIEASRGQHGGMPQPFAAPTTVQATKRREVAAPVRPSEARVVPPVQVPEAAVEPLVAAGRGGAQHKYVQALIKRFAEANGYRATVEKSVLGGTGQIDVALEKEDGVSIACEISISTSDSHEIENIKKCLTAGYSEVVAVVTDAKRQRALLSVIDRTIDQERSRVSVFTIDELFQRLRATSAPVNTETVRGYKVKVRGGTAPTESTGRDTVVRTVLEAMRRLREP